MLRFAQTARVFAAHRATRFAVGSLLSAGAASLASPPALMHQSPNPGQSAPAPESKDDPLSLGSLAAQLPIPPELLGPLIAQASFGSAVGFCSGYAMKRIGKVAAFTVGMGFMAVQALSYSGYIQVEWERLQRDVVRALDADGDGKLTEKDFTVHWNWAMEVMQFELPSASGFVVGFIMGLRM